MSPFNRRRFLGSTLTASTLAASGISLSACGGSGDAADAGGPEDSGPSPDFLYGVASGDPLADRVILWTHARFGELDTPVDLEWEVATDNSFASPVSRGTASASEASGFTVKVDAGGLQPGTEYVFRFRRGRAASPVGRTRTLPVGATAAVRLAVMSCANYPAGYFHVYAAVAASDAQFAVHLGDYLYEYGTEAYAGSDAAALGRLPLPPHEILTRDDYRARYRQVRSDPDAKTLHARMPVIAVWDDHELANNAWREGAQNHSAGSEGSFTARRTIAQQVYHEWLPIRTGSDRSVIYRRFDFGDLLSLHMLDTRMAGRDEQISSSSLLDSATAAQARAGLVAPDRQMLGTTQLQWLQAGLAQSSSTWQVLGQQVLMARREFPASVLQALKSANSSAQALATGQAAISAYLAAKSKRSTGAPLTATEAALLNTDLNPTLGYNLDAWDGYPAAREAVLATALQWRKRLVVLAGDSHNAWHSKLTLQGLTPGGPPAGTEVGEEFATPSVSSPGLERALNALPPAQIEAVFRGVVDDLRWVDASNRGYLKMSFTPGEVRADWVFVSSVKTVGFTVTSGHTAVLGA